MSIPEIHTDLLWDLSVLLGSLCILYFGFIFFFRNRLSAKTRNISERRKQLTPIISNFLFYGEDASKEEKYEYVELKVEVREFIKDPINRSILKEILLDLQRDLTGDARQRLFVLYKDFDLHLDAFAKLNSWRWEIVTKGIVELTQMEVEEAYTQIKKFINHKRSVIRRHAQIATVSLKHEGIGQFLDTNKYPISEWQQIKILEILRNKEDYLPPSFGIWLTSKNKDVVLFALRLIRHYNQTDANASVTELLKHKNEEVKQAAIECIKEFGITEAIPTLMASFKRAKRDTRIFILDALGAIGGEEQIPFLLEVHQKISNFNVKSKALGAINSISPETVLPQDNLDPLIQVSDEAVELEDEEQSVSEESAERELNESPTETIEDNIEITEESSELFYEDLDVFDYCFMEELNEILDQQQIEDDNLEVKYLPLDFLPVVIEKPTAMDKKKPKKKWKRKLRKLNVSYEEVHPDENFRKELEEILSRVEVPDIDGNMETEYLNFNFLPFVIDENLESQNLPKLLQQINELKVDGVEIVLPEENGKSEATKNADIGQPESEEEDLDACAMVDWEDIEIGRGELNKEDTLEELDDNSDSQHKAAINEKATYGFSIFEELFRSCDVESKLILMNEILDLGDQKELAFLKSLYKDPSGKVRDKAKRTAAMLSEKLRKESTKEVETESLVKWEKNSELITLLNFDLTLNGSDSKKTRK
ncbi:HEAT repeat domain-containing protein [Muriicola soli]|uniref:HEAT repeat domain-containing protein n=1 Tax=Muriicola soli TaxID=2507538 RepID=A0A411E974_9FLAO|nr:HEAT repeat domain-containing protein [Muriicola soli]QBA64188.1 HEAT repeat domain-containing protein [Muriicola soli]